MTDWETIETAPKDGTKFHGVEAHSDDIIAMFWHDGFQEFVSTFRRMTMAPGYTIDGMPYKDHSPVIHKPTHWKSIDLPPGGH